VHKERFPRAAKGTDHDVGDVSSRTPRRAQKAKTARSLVGDYFLKILSGMVLHGTPMTRQWLSGMYSSSPLKVVRGTA
jgi:hypothetical protein